MSSKGKIKKKTLKNAKMLFGVSTIIILILVVMLISVLVKTFDSSGSFKLESREEKIDNVRKSDTDKIKTVGWLRVQGTNIDYPVIYAPDYNLSLITDDFAWTEADFGELNNITYISGHNIKNLSAVPAIADPSNTRFEQLMSFVYYDFVKENQYFQYSINGKDYMFKIYSVMFIPDFALNLYNKSSYTKDKMKDYINETLDESIYDFRTDVKYSDKIVSLVTCSRMLGHNSFVVTGRLLRDGEKAKITNVYRTKNYEAIDSALKGGSLNEDA